MDPPEKPPPAAASPSRGTAGAPMSFTTPRATPPLRLRQHPRPGKKPSEVGTSTSTSTTTPERILAKESVRDMENKSCPESDGPVQMSFKFLKEITNNFAVELGCGASAEVYKGEFNRQAIAVKILPFKIGVDERLFQNEYEHLKRLNHPNIVRLVGFCDETELVEAEYEGKMINAEDIHRALCLEFLPNGPLSNHLHENYLGLEWKRHFQIIKGMCAGLKYIHDAPIVHLDIKPENILLDAEMIPKIGDFGISRVLRKECIGDANGTQLGTMGYIPPEFIQNRVISRGFDIFSLGVTIKKTMTGVMDYWNICYMKDEECIEHVLDNWRKRFQEIPHHPSPQEDYKEACILPKRKRESDLQDDSGLPMDLQEMPSLDSYIRTCELPFEFLREITKEFSEEQIVSESTFATVFKETLVKRFRASKKEVPDDVFQNEVEKLKEIKHENIVRLLGYCNEKKREVVKHDGRYILTCKVETFLWYEYVPNRSVDQYIYVGVIGLRVISGDDHTHWKLQWMIATRGDSCQFEWNMRFKIILAICKALHFLHTELNKPIGHHPLTPENILLDKNMLPKLSDIGLSDLFDGLPPEGTEYDPEINRYKAPEYKNGYSISFQSDIYSLGLLIMDIVAGEKDYSHSRQTMGSSHFVNVNPLSPEESPLRLQFIPILDVLIPLVPRLISLLNEPNSFLVSSLISLFSSSCAPYRLLML
uniref:Putative cysteine-rich receptor-like protein kinase 16 n=1 Tax=Aegilops tauschii TaxID=37682 RepID=M8B458_AEGTA